MPRIGGCPRCEGDVMRDANGDKTCQQCGTVVAYSDNINEGFKGNVPVQPSGRKAPKRISRE